MHDLLRSYAAEHAVLDTDADVHSGGPRRTATTRLLDYYVHVTTAAERHFPRGRTVQPPAPAAPVPVLGDLAEARQWLDAERTNLVALTAHAALHGWPHQGRALSQALRPYLDGGSHHRDALAVYHHGLVCCRHLGDRAGEGTALHSLGSVNGRLGNYEQARTQLEQALAIREELGDRESQARTANNLATVYERLGRYGDAADCYRRALNTAHASSDQATEGMVLGNLALVNYRLGKYHEARDCHQQALGIFRQLGDRALEGVELSNLGALYARMGQYSQAVEHGLRALAVSIEVGDRGAEGAACGNLGAAYTALGDHAAAHRYLERALTIHRDLGDRSSEAIVLIYQGHLLRTLGLHEESLRRHRQALSLQRDLGGDRLYEAQALDGIAATLLAMGHLDQARTHYELTMALAEAAGHHYEHARALEGLGHVHLRANQPVQAAESWHEANTIYAALSLPGIPHSPQSVRLQVPPTRC
jgi:tetratricopeptide (TPR) repeat protein